MKMPSASVSTVANTPKRPTANEIGQTDRVIEELTQLEEGQPIVFGGNRTVRVSHDLAAAFVAGDRLSSGIFSSSSLALRAARASQYGDVSLPKPWKV